MPAPLHHDAMPWIIDYLLKPFISALGGFLAAASVGAHVALFIAWAGEMASAHLLLPRSPDIDLDAPVPPEELKLYKRERAVFWRKRRHRLYFLFILVVVALVVGTAAGLPRADHYVAVAAAISLFWQTFANSQKADELLASIRLPEIERFMPRSRRRRHRRPSPSDDDTTG